MLALLLQIKSKVLTMRKIRQIRPEANLLQTNDLGYVRGTAALRHSTDLMNERRWLPFDLLRGKVDRQHPMFEYLSESGIPVSGFPRIPAGRTSSA